MRAIISSSSENQFITKHTSQPCRKLNTVPTAAAITVEQEATHIRPEQARQAFQLSVRQWQHLDAVLRQWGVVACQQRGWPLESFAAALCEAITDAEVG